jgi:hypothetical protein
MTPESSDSISSLDFVQFIGRALKCLMFFGEPNPSHPLLDSCNWDSLDEEPHAMIPPLTCGSRDSRSEAQTQFKPRTKLSRRLRTQG